jgi:hypothetical protein
MSVFVDKLHYVPSAKGPKWAHFFCHLWGSDLSELQFFGLTLGAKTLKRHPVSGMTYFTLIAPKRKRAIRAGAIEADAMPGTTISRPESGKRKPERKGESCQPATPLVRKSRTWKLRQVEMPLYTPITKYEKVQS